MQIVAEQICVLILELNLHNKSTSVFPLRNIVSFEIKNQNKINSIRFCLQKIIKINKQLL